jgi:hypothetical protein
MIPQAWNLENFDKRKFIEQKQKVNSSPKKEHLLKNQNQIIRNN